MRRLGIALMLVGSVLVPSAAQAGTVSVSGGVLRYEDLSGVPDDIQVRRSLAQPTEFSVSQLNGTISAGAGCSGGPDTVTCMIASPVRVVVETVGGDDNVGLSDLGGIPGEVNLGSGSDVGFVVDQVAAFVVILRGGDGDDILVGGNGNDVLDGGADGDTLLGFKGSDDAIGGGGFDLLDYGGEPGRGGNVVVTLDDQGNDGNPNENENDNARSDLEEITGTPGNDTIVGSAASNVLHGEEGGDRLVGGGAIDVLFGEDGADTLEARDGVGELVDCGAGADSATTDIIDSPINCEAVDAAVLAGPAGPILVTTRAVVPTVNARLSFKTVRRGERTFFTKLSLANLQAGDAIQISCSKRRCKPRRIPVKRAGNLALAGFLKSALPPGTTVTIVVTRPAFATKIFNLRVRKGKAPKLTQLCQAPGDSAPRRC